MACKLNLHKALKIRGKRKDWVGRDTDCSATQKILTLSTEGV